MAKQKNNAVSQEPEPVDARQEFLEEEYNATPVEPEIQVELDIIERPSYPSYVLDGALAESNAKLPHAAFKAAAAKYYPEQCVIIAYKVTDTATIVVLDAGLQGRRKEIIGAE